MAPTINLTITVPDGSTSHGTPNLICVPTQWYHFIIFFGANFIAHAFTLVTSPGATYSEQVRVSLHALICPGSGIIRCLRWIIAFAAWESDPLAKAAKAGALCMVLKKQNVSRGDFDGIRDPWFQNVFEDRDVRLVPITRNVYGTFELPRNKANDVHLKYYLAEVPPNTPLEKLKRYRNAATWPPLHETKTLWGAVSEWYGPARSDYTRVNATNRMFGEEPEEFRPETLTLPKNQNVGQLLFALAQSSYAAYTLYRARGNQVDMYGFSAFGLTVAPYALMSVINIIASLCTPAYPCMFLIETRDSEEAREDGGHFAGAVAKVNDDPPILERNTIQKTPTDFLMHSRVYRLMVCLLIIAPIGIVGGLSQFRFVTPGNSLEQRIWISLWLFVGTLSSLWLKVLDKCLQYDTNQNSVNGRNWGVFTLWLVAVTPLWIPAIGGMVQVGLMFSSYGYCTKFDFSPL